MPLTSGAGAGGISGYAGFLVTTFNGQTYFEAPVSVPVYSGPIFVNMGNLSISNGGTIGTATFVADVLAALNASVNSNLPPIVKSAISAALNAAIGNFSTGASVDACFSPAWNGTSTG
jgi:hypothetical protein